MKHLSIVRYVLMAISVLTILLYFTGTVEVDLMLRWGYIMLGLTVAIIVVLSVYGLAQNPKAAVKSLMGLAIFIVIVGISYALSSDAVIVTPSNVYDNPMMLKVADTGLFMTYIALAGSILAIIGGEIYSAIK